MRQVRRRGPCHDVHRAVVLAVAVVSAFVMSVVSIKFLMGYIKKYDFTAFGWYRIVVGALVLGVFALQTAGILRNGPRPAFPPTP